MLASGEDPLYIARRMVRFASEDIGLADPQALAITLHAKEAYDFLGTPEGELALAEAVVYLAAAPKSNRIYTAYGAVQKEVERSPHEPVPLQIRNAVTSLMKEIGYGKDYQYAHDSAAGDDGHGDHARAAQGPEILRAGAVSASRRRCASAIDWWDALKDRIRDGKTSGGERGRRKARLASPRRGEAARPCPLFP